MPLIKKIEENTPSYEEKMLKGSTEVFNAIQDALDLLGGFSTNVMEDLVKECGFEMFIELDGMKDPSEVFGKDFTELSRVNTQLFDALNAVQNIRTKYSKMVKDQNNENS